MWSATMTTTGRARSRTNATTRDFSARFSGDREEVRIDAGGRSYDLEHTDRDNGMRVYTNEDDVELRVDEDEAYLRIPGDSDFQDCERA